MDWWVVRARARCGSSVVRHVHSLTPPLPEFVRRVQSPKPAGALRKGKWTAEEENYTSCIIQDFNKGYLPIVVGTTLRSFLSEKVRRHPFPPVVHSRRHATPTR